MKATTNTALVVGANGVIGTNLIQYLATLDTWNIIALSRKGGQDTPRIRHIAVDLLNATQSREQLAQLTEVTHIFYAAYQDRPTWAELVPPNLAMLVNVVNALEPVAANLRHIS